MLPILGTSKLPHVLDNLAQQTAGARESARYTAIRMENHEERENTMKAAMVDPKVACEQIIQHCEGCRIWPKNVQDWLVATLKKENGVQEVIDAAIENHANADGSDPTRVFPGAPAEMKQKTVVALLGSDLEARVKAKFPKESWSQ